MGHQFRDFYGIYITTYINLGVSSNTELSTNMAMLNN